MNVVPSLPRRLEEYLEGLPKITERDLNKLGHDNGDSLQAQGILLSAEELPTRFCMPDLLHISPCTTGRRRDRLRN
jgi:hypothetical protein